jgi:hypothetical protein
LEAGQLGLSIWSPQIAVRLFGMIILPDKLSALPAVIAKGEAMQQPRTATAKTTGLLRLSLAMTHSASKDAAAMSCQCFLIVMRNAVLGVVKRAGRLGGRRKH